mmetsp:Transcript_67900/g.147881  ORF Transcript_67900/g.147881 Transcript_67900/m.147881 type:complete len:232 (-) Transcript_67900:2107-2802(-)
MLISPTSKGSAASSPSSNTSASHSKASWPSTSASSIGAGRWRGCRMGSSCSSSWSPSLPWGSPDSNSSAESASSYPPNSRPRGVVSSSTGCAAELQVICMHLTRRGSEEPIRICELTNDKCPSAGRMPAKIMCTARNAESTLGDDSVRHRTPFSSIFVFLAVQTLPASRPVFLLKTRPTICSEIKLSRNCFLSWYTGPSTVLEDACFKAKGPIGTCFATLTVPGPLRRQCW